ncbi:MAG: manganese catalase family protein [Oscillospiraceae bacterium]|nr:manganese catalase family protein [Oscillospiraceae bacterium]
MFVYDKKLQYPVKIDKPNPRLAAIIISQYGGPDGELGASLRYLSQRYSMPFDELKGLLTDIGTEAAKRNPLRNAPLKVCLFYQQITSTNSCILYKYV